MRYPGDISPEAYAAMEEGYEQGYEKTRAEAPKVEIIERLNEPTYCKVWRDGVLVFDGVDKSVLLRERD